MSHPKSAGDHEKRPMHMVLRFLAWVTVFVRCTHALNILVWATTIGHSHIAFMGGVADILKQEGHNVTMIILENDPDVTTSGSKYVKNVIRYSSPLVAKDEWYNLNFKKGDVFQTRTVDLRDFFLLQSINYRLCQGLMNDEALLNSLRDSKFSLAIVELFHFCPAGILEVIGVPKIMLATALGMTHAHYELLNLQMPLSHVPVQMTHLGSRIPFFGRLYNVIFYYTSKFCYNYMLYHDQKMFDRRFGSFPRLDELYTSKLDYVLTNTNEFTESTRPTLQSIKYIGGATTRSSQPLDDDFDSILLSSRKGIILFSLGSLIKPEIMPEYIRKAFLEAFLEFPNYSFIWKSASESNFTYPNVYHRNWVPQVDLLADGRVKAFITHGGMNSLQESIFFGVPTIIMPIFADQDSNAMVASERGYSYVLDKFTVTKAKVVAAIRAVMGDEEQDSCSSYTKSARRAARILKGNRRAMRQEISRLVRITGTEPSQRHLRLNLAHLNYVQYHNLDVYGFLFSAFVAAVCLLGFCVDRYFGLAIASKVCKLKTL